MAEGAEDDDKTEEPSQKRIDEARERGEIVYSQEVATAFSLLALTMVASFMAGPVLRDLGALLTIGLTNAGEMNTDGRSLMQIFTAVGLRVGAVIGAVVLALMGAGVAARFVQDLPSWSPKRLSPKLDRLNPFEGAKRVFGKQAVGTFAKTLVKFVIVAAAVAWSLWPRDGTLAMLPLLDVAAIGPLLRDRIVALLVACTAAAAVLAVVDFVFTRQAHQKRLRMTKQEVRDEYRQSEGDPQLKAKLRQLRQERARNRMMTAVPSATVVITNPTHYAVALAYDRDRSPAPICVAKGVNEVALRIRELAEANDVPVMEDPPLARALYASVDLEESIPREHFEAVAKVIGYVMRLAQRRRSRQR